MAASAFTPVRVRYLVRSFVIWAVYLGAVLAAKYLIAQVGVSRPVAIAVALIPGLAVAAMFFNTISMIAATTDEFMRMLAVRQQLITAGFALSVASVWGCLEMFDLVGHVDAIFIVMPWAAGLFIGQISNRITHGVWAECP